MSASIKLVENELNKIATALDAIELNMQRLPTKSQAILYTAIVPHVDGDYIRRLARRISANDLANEEH